MQILLPNRTLPFSELGHYQRMGSGVTSACCQEKMQGLVPGKKSLAAGMPR